MNVQYTISKYICVVWWMTTILPFIFIFISIHVLNCGDAKIKVRKLLKKTTRFTIINSQFSSSDIFTKEYVWNCSHRSSD